MSGERRGDVKHKYSWTQQPSVCGAGGKGTRGAARRMSLDGLAVTKVAIAKDPAWTPPLASQTQRKHNAGEIMMLELVETLSKSKKGRITQEVKKKKVVNNGHKGMGEKGGDKKNGRKTEREDKKRKNMFWTAAGDAGAEGNRVCASAGASGCVGEGGRRLEKWA